MKYPKEVVEAAQVINNWLNDGVTGHQIMELEFIYEDAYEASQERLNNWLDSLNGTPAYMTTYGIDILGGMLEQIGNCRE